MASQPLQSDELRLALKRATHRNRVAAIVLGVLAIAFAVGFMPLSYTPLWVTAPLLAINWWIAVLYYVIPSYLRLDSRGASVLINRDLVLSFFQFISYCGFHRIADFPLVIGMNWGFRHIATGDPSPTAYLAAYGGSAILSAIDIMVALHSTRTAIQFHDAKFAKGGRK